MIIDTRVVYTDVSVSEVHGYLHSLALALVAFKIVPRGETRGRESNFVIGYIHVVVHRGHCYLLTRVSPLPSSFLPFESAMSLSRERDSDGSEDDAAARKRRSTRGNRMKTSYHRVIVGLTLIKPATSVERRKANVRGYPTPSAQIVQPLDKVCAFPFQTLKSDSLQLIFQVCTFVGKTKVYRP
jgi:hypothetical protein